jgi:GST-like protein
MIDLHYWPTPNGHKITIFLEETALDYRIVPVDIGAGEQFRPEFLAIAPNNRMPAIVDHAPADGGEPLSVFESGAILVYLGEKTGRFLPTAARERAKTSEWLFWQMAGFGPMLGQNHHFNRYAPEKIPYAIERYERESARLYGVLDRHLRESEYAGGRDYGIADMAIHPWAAAHEWHKVELAAYPQVQRWFAQVGERPAVQRAYEIGKRYKADREMTDEMRRHLFGAKP